MRFLQPQNILVSIPHALQSVFSILSSSKFQPAVTRPSLILVLQQPGISIPNNRILAMLITQISGKVSEMLTKGCNMDATLVLRCLSETESEADLRSVRISEIAQKLTEIATFFQ